MGLQQELDQAVTPPAPNPNKIHNRPGKKNHKANVAVILLSDTQGLHLASLPLGTCTFLTLIMWDAGVHGRYQTPTSLEGVRKPFYPLN